MINVTKAGNDTRVTFPQGTKLNMAIAQDLKGEFAKLVVGGKGKITVDLTNVDYVDSSGVGALLSLLRNCREKTMELVITGLQPSVRDLFNLLQLQSLFNIQ